MQAASLAPDAHLVERARQGDAEAGRRLVHESYTGIFRYLLRLTGDRELAEDLVQETFVEAWGSLATFQGRAPFRVWLYRIAHRQFLRMLRRRRPQESLETLPDSLAPRAPEMTGSVELRAVLLRLPEETRAIVVLHYLEGYTCEEIAEIVGIPGGTIRYRLFEARARLRRELGDEGATR